MGDNLPMVAFGYGRVSIQVAADHTHTCALFGDGSVKCWGYNNHGELGYEDSYRRGDDLGEMGDNLPVVKLGAGHAAKQLRVGYYHACVILDDDSVKCWGDNAYGQSGYGDKNHRGDEDNEMGDSLPVVDFGADRVARQISPGSFHTCVILDDDAIKCWGRNWHGQIGQDISEHWGDEPDETGDNLPVVDVW